MSQTTITLQLPDSLANEASATGLFEPSAIEKLLREELRRRRVDRLFEAADKLSNLDAPVLTEAEIEAEIQATRMARNPSHASRR
ncbi:hypothetical protein KJ068_24865 [bacterium]|nr:hypothetical protein [bacterium]